MPAPDVASGNAPPEAPGSASVRHSNIWWTRRAVGLHLTVVVLVPAFLALFWWQIDRVREGNTLSWAYVFEWPFFTGYAIYLWWKLVHDQPEPLATTESRASPHAQGIARLAEDAGDDGAAPDEDDGELAAYNRYLAELHASGRRKHW